MTGTHASCSTTAPEPSSTTNPGLAIGTLPRELHDKPP